jgi:anti-sigma28 factor (negative regulator of flagellin synthesis)
VRQYIVDMCVETQNPSKLFDSTDDKLTVSGMHKKHSLISKIANTKACSQMIKQTNNTAEERPDRIDAIRSQLSDDDYVVDSMQIADRIIDIELALAGSN